MNLRNKFTKVIKTHLQTLFPQHPHVYLGRRTGTLLLQALCNHTSTTIILPGFICPHLSTMALSTNKKVIHLDVDSDTLQLQTNLLDKYLNTHPPSETCLLIDHSFGYVNSEVALIKSRYPELLIIEDCARTFGGTCENRPAGSFGDWIILSMYKTVRGNEHGGILLSRKPLSCNVDGQAAHSSPREYLSTINFLRFFYDKIKCIRAPLGSESAIKDSLSYTPEPGRPSYLIMYRFLNELRNSNRLIKQRHQAWQHLHQHLSQNPELELIKVHPKTEPSYYFLSFTIPEIANLHSFLQQLNQAGYFLFNAWPDPPNYYRCFQETFPYGDENTLYLARNIIHISIADFIKKNQQEKFLNYFDKLLQKLQKNGI